VAGNDDLPKGAIQRISIKFGKTRYDEDAGVMAVAWSPNGKMVACRCSDNTVRVFAWPQAKQEHELRLCPIEEFGWDDPRQVVRPIAFSPDSKLLVSSWPAGTAAKVWDTGMGRQVHLLAGDRRWTTCTAFAPNGKVIAMTCPGGIRLWDAKTGQQLRILNDQSGLDKPQGVQTRCIFSPDGETLVTASFGYEIHFWDWRSGDEVSKIGLKELLVSSLALSSDGKTLAVCRGHNVQKAAIYDMNTRRAVHELEGSKGNMPCGVFSPDGVTLATSDEQGNKIILWNYYAGTPIAELIGHKKAVYELAFSPDGGALVSASADGTLLFWKVPKIKGGESETPLEEWKELWEWLGGDDAKLAYWAIWKLRGAGDQTVARIKERVRRVSGVDLQKVQKLIASLDAPAFEKRRNALDELSRIGEQAEPALRKALEGEPSVEMRTQVRNLLGKLRLQTYSGEPLRALRAVQVLERIGTPKAREALEELAKGAAEARLTKDANAAADRLTRRRLAD
jgi:WD40 repeat protein